MLPIDTLVNIGLATISLGTINESDGRQEREFWLRNAGTEAVTLVQGYTSCGCVRLTFPLGKTIQPDDSVRTMLNFDPKGKGGEFFERGTIVYGQSRKRVDIAMEGVCITSEETLMKQFPIEINDGLRLSGMHASVPEVLFIRDGQAAEQALDRRSVAGKEDRLFCILRRIRYLMQKLRSPAAQLLNALRPLRRDVIAGVHKKVHEGGVRDRVVCTAAVAPLINAETDLPYSRFLDQRDIPLPPNDLRRLSRPLKRAGEIGRAHV